MPVHDLLGARHRVYAPVHPGFGASEGLEEIESMEDLVFHAVDVLDALGLERVDVVGLSLGGWLAAELALRHPGRVNRLVLVDAAGTRVPGVVREDLFMASPAKARQLLFADPTSALAAELVPDVPAPERLEAALRGREAAARLLWNPHVQYRKLTSRLGRIKAPTLVVWGRRIACCRWRWARPISEASPGRPSPPSRAAVTCRRSRRPSASRRSCSTSFGAESAPRRRPMLFVCFHLMPWPHLPADFEQRHESAWLDLPNSLYDPVRGHTLYNEYLDQLVAAERLGFDVIGVNEHHQNAYGLMPSPNIMAASLIQRTSRIKVLVLGNALPLYDHPQRVAEELAMLDVLSGAGSSAAWWWGSASRPSRTR